VVLEALGLAQQHFRAFAALLRQAPLRRLHDPSGLEHLPNVRNAIVEDLSRSRDGSA